MKVKYEMDNAVFIISVLINLPFAIVMAVTMIFIVNINAGLLIMFIYLISVILARVIIYIQERSIS